VVVFAAISHITDRQVLLWLLQNESLTKDIQSLHSARFHLEVHDLSWDARHH
jgi:hypothetical protein